MKIISCNVNGIRSAYKKGLIDFITKEQPDILCLQEIKAHKEDLNDDLINIAGYNLLLNPANKKGYSGVAIYTKVQPISNNSKLGIDRFDQEGRLLELKYSNFTLLNLYIPHGGRHKENLTYKLAVYDKVIEKILSLKTQNIILTGDFNIANDVIDLARPKQNVNNIMFTLDERKKINEIIDLGFVDSFRHLNKEPGNYTWWPYAFNAKERNMGWRIDYIFVSGLLSENIINANIHSTINFSDHCPISLEFRLE